MKTLLLILVIATTLLLSSCSSVKNSPTKSDIEALQTIYEQNNYRLRESNISFKIHDKNAFTLSIEGQAIKTENNLEQNESIFVPIALFSKLPQYYKLQENNSDVLELMSYKLKNGLWSMVAIVPIREKKSETNNTSQIHHININLLIVSPDFQNQLPLSVPVGQSKSPIEISILLPNQYVLNSSQIMDDNSATSKLIKFPSSLSQNNVQSNIIWQSDSSNILNFSNISYQQLWNFLGYKTKRTQYYLAIVLFYCLTYFGSFLIFNRNNRNNRNNIFNTETDINNLSYKIDELSEDIKSIFKLSNFLLYIFITIILFISVFVFPSNALAANDQLSFGNFKINVVADNNNWNQTKAILNFIPLSTNKKDKDKSQFDLNIGNQNSTIVKITTTPKKLVDNKIIEINYGKQFTKIKTPTTSVNYLKLLSILNNEALQTEEFVFDKSYYSAIEEAQDLLLQYEINDISEIKEKISKGWLHLYPLEKILLQISFKPKQMVIASDIQINTPLNYSSNISLSGIKTDLERTGDSYHLKKSQENKIIIPAETIISVKGELKRYSIDRLFLTFGQIAIAFVMGFLCIFFASTNPSTNSNSLISPILQGSIPFSSGVIGLFLLHQHILSENPEIPSIISGQIPTIFDLFTIFSILVVFPFIAFFTLKRKWLSIQISVAILVFVTLICFFVL